MRQLLKNPGFTAVAVITLALGIGVNTAMFSLLHTLLFEPLPYPDSARVVRVFRTSPQSRSWPHSPANFLDRREQNRAFVHSAAFSGWNFNSAEPGRPAERVQGTLATGDFFLTLGVAPALGRVFTQADDQPGENRVAVISHGFWQRRFAGDTNVLGRPLFLDGERLTIIGVMPSDFAHRLWSSVDVWKPYGWTAEERANRGGNWLSEIARLKPGISIREAQAEMNTLATRLAQAHPESNAGIGLRVVSLLESLTEGTGRRLLWLSFGLTVFVLFIACANLANLQLARTVVRARELSIRAALGASRLRLMGREIHRQGVVDYTGNHLKPYVGVKARKRAASRVKKRVKHLAIEAVRRPGLAALRTLRSVPLVRTRVVPSLLRQELDQVPAAPIVASLTRELERLRKTSGPILVGPWISEVGFEVLYWAPFLNWTIAAAGLESRRLIVVSRGGARSWYQHLGAEYIDVFDLFTVDEYRTGNEERWSERGHQKQFEITSMEREILDRARKKLGLTEAQVLHPSSMYKLLRFYWYEKASVRLLTDHTDYRRLTIDGDGEALKDLPKDYVAVRFYFRPSFPDTPENRRFAADTVRTISREVPVVLLNTGLSLDDHEDLDVSAGKGVYRVDHLMTPQHNLELQTRVIANARAFVGTYGGLAYVAPFYGVPSVGFYSQESDLMSAHLDVGWRLGRAMHAPLVALDAKNADLLRTLFGVVAPPANAGLRAVKAASAGPR